MRSYEVLRIYQCLWRGVGGGGVTFRLLNESLNFKGTDDSKPQQ